MRTNSFLVLGISILMLAATAPARGTQTLHGHVPAAVTNSTPVGHLTATKHLDLALGLPLRNQDALNHLLAEICDPASPNFHHYLSAEQFAERFGPTEKDYQKLIAFAEANGLRVTGTHPNRTLLDVRGTVADIERACGVTLRLYPHPKEARTFYAPDTEPSLDLDLPVLHISGLDNYIVPHPMNLRAATPEDGSSPKPAGTGSGSGGTFLGNDFRAAYVPGVTLTGTGQTVGLVEFDSGFYTNDITAYESLAGLPNVPVTAVLLDGYNGAPGGQANVEVSLDIEMAISLAPGLSQVLVYEGTSTDDILNRMATDNIAKQLSASWSYPIDANSDQIFLQFAAQGQTYLNASGDSDAYPAGHSPPSPTDDPNITVVGGTTLTTSGPGGAWVSETVWNWHTGQGGGGGISTSVPIPSWQQGISMAQNMGSTSYRNVPDVALTADNIWVLYGNGQSGTFGGTSCATPLWAAFMALANQLALENSQPTVGFINPAVYAIGAGPNYGADFHDITTGNNTNHSSPNLFYAVPGYDLCTGWGTPAGNGLLYDLALPEPLRISPAANVISGGPVGGPFNPISQAFSLTNGGTAALNWTLVGITPWLNVTPTNGTLTPGGSVTIVTASLNSAASYLAAGSYPAVLWFTNLNDNYGQSRQFVLDVVTPPVISSQPANQAVVAGTPATFTVGTGTNALLYYQWQEGGTNLSDGGDIVGSTTSTLTISNVEAVNVGAYSVIISNAAGVVTSSNAQLSITPSIPIITMQPTNVTAQQGGTANFSVSVVGSPPFFYQWYDGTTPLVDGGNITGSATANLSINNLQAPNAGTYSVVISNSIGSATSSNAVLSLNIITSPGATFTLLLKFSGDSTGVFPQGGLVQGNDGNFYGTTVEGGAYGNTGAVFKMTPNNTQSLLYSFTDRADGASPGAALIQATDGYFYGTTTAAGAYEYGNVFRITTNGTFTALGQFNNTNGGLPQAPVMQGTDGNFYGATYLGGPYNMGTVFKMSSNGAITSLCSFNGTTDGAHPWAGLIQASDGNFYGTTINGGTNGRGTVFQVTPDGTLNTLYSFDGTHGKNPYAGLVQGTDGYLYGATYSGAANNYGGIFRITTTGLFTNIYSFTGSNDGRYPGGALVQGSDGNFYGTTEEGGLYNNGTVFQFMTNGTLTTLVHFDGYNGADPQAPLIQTANGNFYGTTVDGGVDYNGTQNSGLGVIFQVTVSMPPHIISQPTNRTTLLGGNVMMVAPVYGAQPLSFQWQFNGTNLVDNGHITGSQTNALSITNAQLADAGNYQMIVTNTYGSTTSSVAVLTVYVLPAITNQPQSETVLAGSNAVFAVGATGTMPLSYQWQFNNANIASATNSNYIISNAQSNNQGSYSVVVTNIVGAVTSSNAVLTVNYPPTITGQPTSRTVNQGKFAAFIVTASGTPTLHYQWQLNGSNVVAATNSNYVITSSQPSQAGNYQAIITNAYGSATSSVVTLTVITPPAITGQPKSQTVTLGSNATFTVNATGGNLSYQWRFNSGAIVGGTASSYTLFHAQTNNSGNYSVVVTNTLGSVTSSNALLTINPPTPPPQFLSVNILSNGLVQMVLSGQLNNSYAIDGSTDLSNWTQLVMFLNTNGTYQFTDSTSTNHPYRFYRGRLAP